MRDKMNYRPLTGSSLSFTRTYNLSVHEKSPCICSHPSPVLLKMLVL